MIKTEKLSKVYSSGTRALDDLSIHVEEGEIFGFLGPNGAGKSTAIKILTTLSRPTSGLAWICGYNVLTEADKVRCSIGYVAQETGVDYFLSGRENLILQGRLYRMDSKTINSRVEELLELFDIKESADALVSTYSGGMRRKLDIATALIHNPGILFLDEPTLGLDPHSRSSLWNYIRILNRDLKVTIFLTTHYLDEADKLSNRIGILHKGNMKIVDTPEALKDSIKGDSVNLSLNGGSKERAITILKGNNMVKDLLCEDGHVRVYVNNGSESIPGLMKLLNQHGIEILSLTISRPSLDDVYLKYSGVSFKEGESAEGGEPWWAKWQKGGGGKKWKGGGDWGKDGSKEGEGGDQQWEGGGKKEEGKTLPQGEDKGWNKDWQEQGGWGQEGAKGWEGVAKQWKSEEKEREGGWQEGMNHPSQESENRPSALSEDKDKDNDEKPWEKWKDKKEGGWDKKEEEGRDKDEKPEEEWKKWGGNAADWKKWGNGEGQR